MTLMKQAPTSQSIGEMTVEVMEDRVALYGSLDLTVDKPGLANAEELMAILQEFRDRLRALEAAGELPDAIHEEPIETVTNPLL